MSTGDPPIYLGGGGPNWHYITASSYEPTYTHVREFNDIKDRLSLIEDRLAIIRPNNALQEKYPALKEAYEHYLLIEKLVKEQNGTKT